MLPMLLLRLCFMPLQVVLALWVKMVQIKSKMSTLINISVYLYLGWVKENVSRQNTTTSFSIGYITCTLGVWIYLTKFCLPKKVNTLRGITLFTFSGKCKELLFYHVWI
jgi:hypothetical protein